MTMKRTFLLGVAMLCTQLSFGQYVPASATEYTYHSIVPTSCAHNDVGTDTRDATGSSVFGYGSSYYLNYLNVTVNSCKDNVLLAPTFNWQSSAGTQGTLALPADAEDPDVVLVSPMTSNDVWAVVVYYSPSMAGYYMSYASFTPGTWNFPSMSAPVMIYPYIPAAGYEPHINIDADNMGHYAVVMQDNSAVLTMTQTVAAVPTAPANPLWFSGLLEPDVAFHGNSAHEVSIIGVTASRNRYRTLTRDYLGTTWYSMYNSPSMPSLYLPRIAAPSSGITNEYAITVARKYASGPGANFDILFQVNELSINVANNGSMLGYPGPNNVNNLNFYPCLTYAYTGLGTNEQLSLGWYTDAIAGSPNQAFTFIGLDVTPVAPYTCSTPGNYMDITNLWEQNNDGTLALSGRYSSWAKSAAFTYSTASDPNFADRLMWKIQPSGATNWKPTDVDAVANENTGVAVYPNPATNEINISVNTPQPYSYEIYNQLGQIVEQGAINGSNKTVTIAKWANGLYIVKMKNQETQEMSTVQFVKQ